MEAQIIAYITQMEEHMAMMETRMHRVSQKRKKRAMEKEDT